MQNSSTILAQYEAAKVEGRDNLDPRVGVYKIISTYNGTFHGKPALMAYAYWKKSLKENYLGTFVTIQLETFKLKPRSLDMSGIVGKEIEVTSANWYPQVSLFAVDCRISNAPNPTLDEINETLSQNISNVDISNMEDFGDDNSDDLYDFGDY